MSYNLPKDIEEFRQYVRDFAEKKVKPIAFQLDQTKEFPKEIVKEMGKLGLLSIPFDQKWGGAGLSQKHYAIAVEELSRVDGGVGVYYQPTHHLEHGESTNGEQTNKRKNT